MALAVSRESATYAERYERLAPVARRVLRLAAAPGGLVQPYGLASLRKVEMATANAVRKALASLEESELVVRRARRGRWRTPSCGAGCAPTADRRGLPRHQHRAGIGRGSDAARGAHGGLAGRRRVALVLDLPGVVEDVPGDPPDRVAGRPPPGPVRLSAPRSLQIRVATLCPKPSEEAPTPSWSGGRWRRRCAQQRGRQGHPAPVGEAGAPASGRTSPPPRRRRDRRWHPGRGHRPGAPCAGWPAPWQRCGRRAPSRPP